MKRQTKLLQKALSADIFNTEMTYTNLKPIIYKFMHDKWQKSWDNRTHNKLHYIQHIPLVSGQLVIQETEKKLYIPDFVLATPKLHTHNS